MRQTETTRRACARAFALTLLGGALSCAVFGGDDNQNTRLEASGTDEGTRFTYRIAHPETIRAAWIEVWDRPLRLDRKRVGVQAQGELVWDWDKSQLNGPYDGAPLELSIYDPNNESLVCDGLVIRLKRGGTGTAFTLGKYEEPDPVQSLERLFVRATEGGGPFSFGITGHNLTSSTAFSVSAEGGAECNEGTVQVKVRDERHALVSLPSDCLRKAGTIALTTSEATGEEHRVRIYVAGTGSPVLQSVSPSSLPIDLGQSELELTITGSGFSPQSKVYAGYEPNGNYIAEQFTLETEYLSPTRLRARVAGSEKGETWRGTIGGRIWDLSESAFNGTFRIWVLGNPEAHELSAPKDIAVRPAKPRPDEPRVAVVTAISPLWIPLMDERSPKEQLVTIRGRNFVPGNKVMVSVGYGENVTVRSELVSPELLRAWIPRQRWRSHHIVYRLVLESKSGKRFVRELEGDVDGGAASESGR